VIVLLEETSPAAGSWPGVPRVIVGSYELEDEGPQESGLRRLPGPFQYPELIAAIEDLLAGGRTEARC
jgi:hypothetical protein